MKSNGVPPAAGERKRGAAVPPDPEVSAKAKRRRFTAGYKLSIIERPTSADTGRDRSSAAARGAVRSHLSAWRKAAREGSLRELARKRGPKAFGREAGFEEPAKARA